MQLKCFAVKGYKNFKQEITLEQMGAICVIHGENNVGKSNVLEAIQLFFQIVSQFLQTSPVNLKTKQLEELEWNSSEIFHLECPNAITFNATLALNSSEIESLKIDTLKRDFLELDIQVELKQVGANLQCSITLPPFLEQLADKTPLTQLFTDKFLLIGIDRCKETSKLERTRGIVPHSLILQLYDLKNSKKPSHYQKWQLFVRTLQKFNDLLGEGEFIILFDRHANQATVVFESPSTRIPLEMLGAGIQQVVVLIARLLISDASLIAIEEPELNLRYTLQLRLQEIFNDIVKDKVGPQQLFLTSHSPAFEFGDYFYAMKPDNKGPTMKRYPLEHVDIFTQHWPSSHQVGKKAPLCYVSGDGMVQLPERIRQLLSIEQGGGIFLLKRKDNEQVELLTDEQYLDLFELQSDE